MIRNFFLTISKAVIPVGHQVGKLSSLVYWSLDAGNVGSLGDPIAALTRG